MKHNGIKKVNVLQMTTHCKRSFCFSEVLAIFGLFLPVMFCFLKIPVSFFYKFCIFSFVYLSTQNFLVKFGTHLKHTVKRSKASGEKEIVNRVKRVAFLCPMGIIIWKSHATTRQSSDSFCLLFLCLAHSFFILLLYSCSCLCSDWRAKENANERIKARVADFWSSCAEHNLCALYLLVGLWWAAVLREIATMRSFFDGVLFRCRNLAPTTYCVRSLSHVSVFTRFS